MLCKTANCSAINNSIQKQKKTVLKSMMQGWCLLNYRSVQSFNTPARKRYLLNYRVCMGTVLQRTYGPVHIIANYSAKKLNPQTKWTDLKSMMQRSWWCLLHFRSTALILKLTKSNCLITEHVWKCHYRECITSHNCESLGYKWFNPKTKMIALIPFI